jgi:hypothetical protein
MSEAKKTMSEIDKHAAQFMTTVAQILKDLQSRPKIKHLELERAPGQKPRAIPVYEEPAPTGQ